MKIRTAWTVSGLVGLFVFAVVALFAARQKSSVREIEFETTQVTDADWRFCRMAPSCSTSSGICFECCGWLEVPRSSPLAVSTTAAGRFS